MADFKDEIEVFKKIQKLRELDVAPLKGTQSLPLESLVHRANVLDYIRLGNWKGLSKEGTSLIEPFRDHLDSTLKLAIRVEKNKGLARSIDRHREKHRKALLKYLDSPEKVIKQLVKSGSSEPEIKKLIKSTKKALKAPAESEFARLNEVETNLALRIQWLNTLALLGIQCRWLSSFNRKAHGTGPRKKIGMLLKQVRKTLADQESKIEAFDQQIHTHLKNGDWKAIKMHCNRGIKEALTANLAGKTLIKTAILLEKLNQRTQFHSNRKNRSAVTTLCAQCGYLLRRQIFSYGIAMKYYAISSLPLDASEQNTEHKRANKRNFKSLTPSADSISLAELNTNPSQYHDKPVCVEGVIRNLRSTVIRGKPRTHFTIYDATTRKRIRGFTPWFQLDSMGFTSGCHVQIIGKWLKYDPESRQHNVIHLDRISYTDQSKKSWLDYQAKALRTQLDYRPHSFNIKWSWQPSHNGAVNLLRYTQLWLGNGGL